MVLSFWIVYFLFAILNYFDNPNPNLLLVKLEPEISFRFEWVPPRLLRVKLQSQLF
ncbi:hypothetical protein LguiB_027222 [Lonicera macranthoides]